jgi:hypothetical protein
VLITGEVRVSPAIVVTVAPEAIDVEPIVGAEYEATVPQDEVVPSVVRYLPELPVWLGTTKAVESVATRVLLDGIVVPLIDVAVATPSTGVTRVGLVFITNVEPVPVWAATLVAEPTDVIGPVKLLGATVTVST